MNKISNQSIQVLIIEDELHEVALVQDYLEQLPDVHFQVYSAQRLAKGLEMINDIDPDILLLDLSLPDSAGLDTYLNIKELYPVMPVVILSGFDDRDFAIGAVREGAQDYLVKGQFDGRLLVHTIRYAIERMTILSELRTLKEFNEHIVQHMADGVVVTDAEKTITFVNPALTDLLGFSAREIIGRHRDSIIDPNYKSLVEEAEKVLKNGKNDQHEIELVRKDFKHIPVVMTSSPFYELNRYNGSVSVFTDITSLRTAEKVLREKNEELQKLDQLKNHFISSVSHELRTPMAIIKEGVSLCVEGIAGGISERQKELLTHTMENIDRLAFLIDDILDFSIIESNEIILRKTPCDLCETIRNIHENYRSRCEQKHLSLILDIPEDRVVVTVDEEKIIKVFNNLIDNSIQFTKPGGCITIRLMKREDRVECSVTDTGIGIAQKNLSRLFSKFEQFNRKDGPGYKGTGLGLAIVKGLVEKHGGKIWVNSEERKGTTIGFSLSNHTLPKILIVDDARNIVDIIKRFLDKENYIFIEAYDGVEALKKAREEKPSLIILDIMLPGISGYAVMEELRLDPKTRDIPIMILSAAIVNPDRLKNRDSKKEIPILGKPIKPKELIESVKEIVNR